MQHKLQPTMRTWLLVTAKKKSSAPQQGVVCELLPRHTAEAQHTCKLRHSKRESNTLLKLTDTKNIYNIYTFTTYYKCKVHRVRHDFMHEFVQRPKYPHSLHIYAVSQFCIVSLCFACTVSLAICRCGRRTVSISSQICLGCQHLLNAKQILDMPCLKNPAGLFRKIYTSAFDINPERTEETAAALLFFS